MHILLALQLALWSPVMCCCAIKGAFSTVTGVGASSCEAGTCCAKQVQTLHRPCCGQADEIDSSEKSPTKTDGDCRCHERVSVKVQLDTGGKIHVPAPQIAVFIADASRDAVASSMSIAAFFRPNLRSHPPPSTLLSQRCLLLI